MTVGIKNEFSLKSVVLKYFQNFIRITSRVDNYAFLCFRAGNNIGINLVCSRNYLNYFRMITHNFTLLKYGMFLYAETIFILCALPRLQRKNVSSLLISLKTFEKSENVITEDFVIVSPFQESITTTPITQCSFANLLPHRLIISGIK